MLSQRNIQVLSGYLEREMGQTFLFDIQEGWFGWLENEGVRWSGFLVLASIDSRNLHLHFRQNVNIYPEAPINPDAFFATVQSYSIPRQPIAVAVNPYQAIFPTEDCDNFFLNKLCQFHIQRFRHPERRQSVQYQSNKDQFGISPAKLLKIILKGPASTEKERRKILQIRNNGYRNRLVQAMGQAMEFKTQVIDENKHGKLIHITTGQRFLSLIDPSTGLRYFLRVPEDIEGVEEGRAWSFGLSLEEWKSMQNES